MDTKLTLKLNKTKNIVPKGFNGFLEPMIVFIRDEIAIPNIGHQKFEKEIFFR
jgi:F-type H+-transporting ATPase subunit a